MTTFTRVIRDRLLADDDMASAVKDLVLSEPDPAQRVLRFACILAENFAESFGRPDDHDDADTTLVKRLVLLASERVVWSRIAKSIIEHCTTPPRLAHAADCPHRLTEALAGWHGNCN